jgi:hypothetical protein
MRGAGIGKRQFLGDKSIAQPRSPSYGQLVLIREEQCGDYDDVATVHAGAFGSHGAVVVPLVADAKISFRDAGWWLPGLAQGDFIAHRL